MYAYIHTQVYVCISTNAESEGPADRRMRRKCNTAKRKHSIFGHGYYSLFIPVAAYDNVVHRVSILLA